MDRDDEYRRINELFDELFPITRSITGPGFRKSIEILRNVIPLDLKNISSGTDIFDWTVPKEWHIHDARLTGPNGNVYADYSETNLAVVNYSEPVDEKFSLPELQPHLHSDPEVPEAIPYVTSYYDKNWGFCLPHNKRIQLPKGEYHAYIDSEFIEGELNFGHTVLPGETDNEILLSTYLCHPSMANNELSGPLVMTMLYNRIASWDDQHYTYRFVVCPETIGSIAYLSEYGSYLTDHVVGGLVLTCLGGPKESLSYKNSRRETALIDRLIRHINSQTEMNIRKRRFTPENGSDERQFCSPGFDLPVGQIARTVYAEYEGYHNSKDTKEFMQITSLIKSANVIERILRAFEYSGPFKNLKPYGEPMLSKRSLYTSINSPETWSDSTDAITDDNQEFVNHILWMLSYSDGYHTMIDIANQRNNSIFELAPIIDRLQEEGLLARIDESTAFYGELPAKRFTDTVRRG